MPSNEPMTAQERAAALGARIRKLRDAAGLTQTELAARTAGVVSQNAISSWEKGQVSPQMDKLASVAHALGITLAELVAEEVEAADGPDLEAARKLIEELSPAFAAIRRVVTTAPKPGASKREA